VLDSCHWLLRLDPYRYRLTQDRLRKSCDLLRHRCRKHHRLTIGRKLLNNRLNIGHETHIKHTIGFIENKKSNTREMYRLSANVVHEAPRARNNYLRIVTKLGNLIAV
jgi:hypothetical protein